MPFGRSDRVFGLVDGNNFYVSCERVFNPALIGKPVIVLSNNDGCAVARSQEAKDLGVAMGEPWFKLRHLERKGLIALSSNYALYGDMSARMMSIIGRYSPRQEVYSIDESFLEFEGFQSWDLTEHSQRIRKQIRQWIGIPVCVGLGPTKTLAKVANRIAKKRSEFEGVCNLSAMPAAEVGAWLGQVEVGDVWGIGPRLSRKLNALGIQTALDLARARASGMRERFGVQVERTIRELRGHVCFDLETEPAPKQQIVSSRSFGQLVETKHELAEALHTYMARAGEKLRAQESLCSSVGVFLQTNHFLPNEPQYHPSVRVPLPCPADDCFTLARAAIRSLDAIYRPEFRYKKAGVMLLELSSKAQQQQDLFVATPTATGRLTAVVDRVNLKMGRDALRLAVAGSPAWAMRKDKVSPEYTSSWTGLLRVG